MPRYQPDARLSYFGILRSLPTLLRDVPILRRRAAYHAALYASFSLFWTAVPLLLASDRFGLTQRGIGLFALAGTGGVIIAPIAGIIADRGWTKPATGLRDCGGAGSVWDRAVGGEMRSISLLVIAAILIDAGLVINFVLSQRSIYGPRAGEPQPHRRAVHRDLLRRWRARLRARGREPRRGRLAAHHLDRNGFAAAALALYVGELFRSRRK